MFLFSLSPSLTHIFFHSLSYSLLLSLHLHWLSYGYERKRVSIRGVLQEGQAQSLRAWHGGCIVRSYRPQMSSSLKLEAVTNGGPGAKPEDETGLLYSSQEWHRLKALEKQVVSLVEIPPEERRGANSTTEHLSDQTSAAEHWMMPQLPGYVHPQLETIRY